MDKLTLAGVMNALETLEAAEIKLIDGVYWLVFGPNGSALAIDNATTEAAAIDWLSGELGKLETKLRPWIKAKATTVPPTEKGEKNGKLCRAARRRAY